MTLLASQENVFLNGQAVDEIKTNVSRNVIFSEDIPNDFMSKRRELTNGSDPRPTYSESNETRYDEENKDSTRILKEDATEFRHGTGGTYSSPIGLLDSDKDNITSKNNNLIKRSIEDKQTSTTSGYNTFDIDVLNTLTTAVVPERRTISNDNILTLISEEQTVIDKVTTTSERGTGITQQPSLPNEATSHMGGIEDSQTTTGLITSPMSGSKESQTSINVNAVSLSKRENEQIVSDEKTSDANSEHRKQVTFTFSKTHPPEVTNESEVNFFTESISTLITDDKSNIVRNSGQSTQSGITSGKTDRREVTNESEVDSFTKSSSTHVTDDSSNIVAGSDQSTQSAITVSDNDSMFGVIDVFNISTTNNLSKIMQDDQIFNKNNNITKLDDDFIDLIVAKSTTTTIGNLVKHFGSHGEEDILS
ncbi:hypothetical protein SK128_018384, partial [Halocaridina rubra]